MTFGRVVKWGNSLGVRLSKRVAEREGIKEGDEVILTKRPITAGELTSRFGPVPRKTPTQRLKDEARRGWGA